MKMNIGAIIGIAAVAGLGLWALTKGKTPAGATPGGLPATPTGTTHHTYQQDGQTVYVPADPSNVFVRNKYTGQTTWVPNSAAPAYLAGDWELA